MPPEVAFFLIFGFFILGVSFTCHTTWIGDSYSAPQIVLKSGDRIFDDFREGYAWLKANTAEEDKIASWWDYGYQTTAMANRTVLVDNNTWNNTHIATVGKAMASPEPEAWKILRAHDVKYVFVIFGGIIGFSSDDINKFLWMVRIAGGVYPKIQEKDYLSSSGRYTVDHSLSEAMKKSLMYRLSYYNHHKASEVFHGHSGLDRVRNVVIGERVEHLDFFEEAFSSKYLMIRIFRVLDKARPLPTPSMRLEEMLARQRGQAGLHAAAGADEDTETIRLPGGKTIQRRKRKRGKAAPRLEH